MLILIESNIGISSNDLKIQNRPIDDPGDSIRRPFVLGHDAEQV
jgi:hypothetical protein